MRRIIVDIAIAIAQTIARLAHLDGRHASHCRNFECLKVKKDPVTATIVHQSSAGRGLQTATRYAQPRMARISREETIR